MGTIWGRQSRRESESEQTERVREEIDNRSKIETERPSTWRTASDDHLPSFCFLDVATHLSKRAGPLVRRSVLSVGLSVNAFFSLTENDLE